MLRDPYGHMKRAWITVASAVVFVGCSEREPSYGFHRLSDELDGSNREVQVILEQLSQSDQNGFHDLLEVLHPDLRLFNEPVSESNRRTLVEFEERLEARRDNLEFVVTQRFFVDDYEVVEVLVASQRGLPKLWYFLRKGENGRLLLRGAPGLSDGYQFKTFVLELSKETIEKYEFSNAMAAERERRIAAGEISP